MKQAFTAQYMIQALSLCLLWAWSLLANAEPTPFRCLENTSNPVIGQHIQYLEDPTREMTIGEVMVLNSRFWNTNTQRHPSFGFSDSAYWLRFSLESYEPQVETFYLVLEHAVLDHLEVYVVDAASGDLLDRFITGERTPFHTRPINHNQFVFPILLEYGDRAHVFMRMESEGTMVAPLYVYHGDAFEDVRNRNQTLFGLFLGVMLVTAAYNLLLYARVRHISYLHFTLFSLGFATFIITLKGYAYQILWPNWPVFNEKMLLWSVDVAFSFFCAFTISYLRMRRYSPSLYTLGTVLACVPVVLAVGVAFVPFTIMTQLHQYFALVLGTFLIGSTLYLWSKGVIEARWYALAMFTLVLGSMLFALRNAGVLEHAPFLATAAPLGAMVTIILLSFAQSSIINRQRVARDQAQEEAITNLKRFQSVFQHSHEGLFVSTAQGEILEVNPAFLRIFGYPEHASMELVNQRRTVDYYKHRPDFEILSQKLLTTGAVIDHEAEALNLKGDSLWVELSLRLTDPDNPETSLVEGSVVDVTEKRERQLQLEFMACHDPLTLLWNRREFESHLVRAVAEVHAAKATYTLLYLDLDQFKVVNDTCGHEAGDRLLKELTAQMLGALDGSCVLARLGGDEFGVLIPLPELEALQIAEGLRQVVERYRFLYEGRMFSLGVSIGLVELSYEQRSVIDSKDKALSLADTVCFAAKDEGRNRIHVYSPNDQDMHQRRVEMSWVSLLHEAIEQDKFMLFQQTIAAIQGDDHCQHYEILLRLRQGDDQEIPPGSFIPAAERYNLMPQIDRWVVQHYFYWLHKHPEHAAQLGKVSINLSGQSLTDSTMKAFIDECFELYPVAAEKICFEITESSAVTNLSKTVDFIEHFRARGCSFSLDDFGSGFSSYAYLKNLPVDYLKIDGVFVKNLHEDFVDHTMVKSINEVAKVMGMKTVAEFVENEATVRKLKAIGVDYAQGYGIAQPQPLDQLLDRAAAVSSVER